MGSRRVALTTSDDKEEEAVVLKLVTSSGRDEEEGADRPNSKRARVSEIEERQGDEAENMEEEEEDAKPVGEAVRFSGKGRSRKSHFQAFEYDGNHYDLEDPVLLIPEETSQKPGVAIIKDITQAENGIMMVTAQRFYRPEEAEKKGGGNWHSNDARELFYSYNCDDVPAESVMHKCVVHLVPIQKQIPNQKQHPGFIVQKVYDTVEKKLLRLTDKDYEDKQAA